MSYNQLLLKDLTEFFTTGSHLDFNHILSPNPSKSTKAILSSFQMLKQVIKELNKTASCHVSAVFGKLSLKADISCHINCPKLIFNLLLSDHICRFGLA